MENISENSSRLSLKIFQVYGSFGPGLRRTSDGLILIPSALSSDALARTSLGILSTYECALIAPLDTFLSNNHDQNYSGAFFPGELKTAKSL